MPYELRQSSTGYCVHKQGGALVPGGRHKSKSKAFRHMRALYANEPEAMKEHTGVMVALPVPQDFWPFIAELQVQLPRGAEKVPVEESHVTLLYLGDSSEVEPLKTQIYAGSLNAIEWQSGIPARLTGLARFNGNEGGKNPLVLLVDSSLLPEFRHRLFSHLKDRGIPDSQRHGFIPHITLGYIPVDAKTPQMDIPQAQIVFDSFVVAWGDEQLIVPLSGAAAYKADGRGYSARAGETIRGNLARGGDGKFASAGSAEPASEESKPAPRRQKLGRTAAAREERKRQAREAKRQASASERERKRQERASASEKRRQEVAARRAAEKKRRQEAKRTESERELQDNRKRTLERTPLNKEAYDSLLAFAEARDGEFDPRMIEAIAKETGLISIGSDGTFRLNPESKAFLKALDKGDARAAMDAFSRAGDRLERDISREEKRQAREESEKEAGLSVFKDASGRYRWVLLSSNAYRDRDGEIISTKALAQDVARADADGDYGPLRWWHMPGMDIGDCDFNALSGRVLVESGTFRNEAIGEAVFKSQQNLQASIGFRHPHTEPDREKVYNAIRRFERSLTPRGRAANPYTMLVVKQGERMNEEKLEALKALIGEDGINAIVAQVQATQKAAESAGVAFKEASEETEAGALNPNPPNTLTASGVASFITSGNSGTVTIKGLTTDVEIEIEEGNEEATKDDDSFADDERVYAGDLEPGELASLVAGAVAQALVPALGEVVKELKALMGTARKDDDIALLQEQAARKALEDAQTIAALKAQQEALATQFKEVNDKLAELTGEQPRVMQQGYRASQAADTVTQQDHRLKESRPVGIDPGFLNAMMGGSKNETPPGW